VERVYGPEKDVDKRMERQSETKAHPGRRKRMRRRRRSSISSHMWKLFLSYDISSLKLQWTTSMFKNSYLHFYLMIKLLQSLDKQCKMVISMSHLEVHFFLPENPPKNHLEDPDNIKH
jgi:hypothetical protein